MRRALRVLLLACVVGAAAAADGTCSASNGEPCTELKLNQSVLMSEMSWYAYSARVKAGVTVIVPVGSTEQVRER
jgi:hypothetical protein